MGSIDQFNKDYSSDALKEAGHTWICAQQLSPINL
jgi:hypothetical protein